MTDRGYGPHAFAELIGTWSGHGHGDYPTIEPFDYLETIELVAPPGKPFLAYTQRTRHAAGGHALHSEAGFLRPTPDDGRAELVIAQPTGIAETYEGSWVDGVLDLRAGTVARTSTAKPVTAVRRRIEVRGDTLVYDLWMAHADTPETHHLRAELERQA